MNTATKTKDISKEEILYLEKAWVIWLLTLI